MTEQEHHTNLTFDIETLIPISEILLDAIKLGLTTVWIMNMNEPHNFKIVIASYITDEEMIPTGEQAYYDPDLDKFYFGIHTITEKFGDDLTSNLFVLAAHECYHLVQTLRGARPTPSRSLTATQYANDYQEAEAWEAAKKAVLHLDPRASGKLFFEGKVVLDLDQPRVNEKGISWQEKEIQNEVLATEVYKDLKNLLPFPNDFYDLRVIATSNGVVVNLKTVDDDELQCDIYPKTHTSVGSVRIIFVRSKVKGRDSLFVRAINKVSQTAAGCEISRASNVIKDSRGFWEKMGYKPESYSNMDWVHHIK